jgi:hypothetical protein
VSVEDGSDELWVAVKCQSNLEIAGSPRNVLRYSHRGVPGGGRALFECGAKCWLPTSGKLRMPPECSVSETAGAKLRRRKGNSPDPQLRAPNPCSVSKGVSLL